jgi:hypothetical protein
MIIFFNVNVLIFYDGIFGQLVIYDFIYDTCLIVQMVILCFELNMDIRVRVEMEVEMKFLMRVIFDWFFLNGKFDGNQLVFYRCQCHWNHKSNYWYFFITLCFLILWELLHECVVYLHRWYGFPNQNSVNFNLHWFPLFP